MNTEGVFRREGGSLPHGDLSLLLNMGGHLPTCNVLPRLGYCNCGYVVCMPTQKFLGSYAVRITSPDTVHDSKLWMTIMTFRLLAFNPIGINFNPIGIKNSLYF